MRRTGIGGGRPLVMFHLAPGSSASFEPLMLRLATDRPVITFDNPGAGDSAPPAGEPEIADLAAILLDAVDAVGLSQYDLYGAHTGALIAMEAAIARPDQARHAILDGITLMEPEETADRLANYAPKLWIGQDGGYILWAWHYRRDMLLWSPWYNKTGPGIRRGAPFASTESLHNGFVEFMKGARTFHLLYRAAFSYPTATRLPLIEIPVLHTTSPHDSLRGGLQRAGTLAKRAEVRFSAGNADAAAIATTVDLYKRFLDDQELPPPNV
jgi:pimeloyl-ACP methyl ester carboxylesterase